MSASPASSARRRRSKGEGVIILAARLARTAAAPAPSPFLQTRADSWSVSFKSSSPSSKFGPPASVKLGTDGSFKETGHRTPHVSPQTPHGTRSPAQLGSGAVSVATAHASATAAVATLSLDETPPGSQSSLFERRRRELSPTGTSPQSPGGRERKSTEKQQLTIRVVSDEEAPRVRVPSPGTSDGVSGSGVATAETVLGSGNRRALQSPGRRDAQSPRRSPKPGPPLDTSSAATTAPPSLAFKAFNEETKLLKEKVRRLEQRALRAEAATREAERAHLTLTRRRLAAERLVEAHNLTCETLTSRASELEMRLTKEVEVSEKWHAKARELRLRTRAALLSPDQKTDAFLKAGFLAHYWRLAYALGIKPDVSWREASVWVKRAPAGKDDALLLVIKAVREAYVAGSGTPGFCKHEVDANRGGDSFSFSDDTDDTLAIDSSDVYSEYAPRSNSANGGWSPTDARDSVEVETAMRVLVGERIEESVLVALADRRRALASRTATRFSARSAAQKGVSTDSPPRMHGANGTNGTSPALATGPNTIHVSSESPNENATAANDDWITLSPAETSEVEYRRLWVCWVWSRARGLPHQLKFAGLAEPRCEKWFRRAAGNQPVFAAAREALEVEHALREIRVLGVEHALVAARNGERGVT